MPVYVLGIPAYRVYQVDTCELVGEAPSPSFYGCLCSSQCGTILCTLKGPFYVALGQAMHQRPLVLLSCTCQLAGGGVVRWSDMERLFDILRSGAKGGEDPRCRADGFICTALGGRKDSGGRVQVRSMGRLLLIGSFTHSIYASQPSTAVTNRHCPPSDGQT